MARPQGLTVTGFPDRGAGAVLGPCPHVERPAVALSRRLGLGATPSLAAASFLAVAAFGAPGEAALVALPEELLFRGVLQGEIAERTGRPATAVIAAAAAFAAAHVLLGGGPQSLLTFFPGLGFGWLRARTGSIWPAVAAHAVANVLWLAWHGVRT
jgi:hypothetical protein